ncbi:MAG: hypothetical protein A3F68_06385 [Acidobacteria bacterium RIFCSPLOWO2_12_FULL_54_10]|nr:MAG: hypothetical protein A3F68_06385 [Acidobacteria bacterium RIFCSPLOWO2_12_FULL_54_10]
MNASMYFIPFESLQLMHKKEPFLLSLDILFQRFYDAGTLRKEVVLVAEDSSRRSEVAEA